MTDTTDRLVAVPRSKWPELRDLYRQELADNFVGYQAIGTFIRWSNNKHQLSIDDFHYDIFSLNGEWQDGTFIAVVSNQIRC